MAPELLSDYIWECRLCGARFSGHDSLRVLIRSSRHLRAAHEVYDPMLYALIWRERWFTPGG